MIKVILHNLRRNCSNKHALFMYKTFLRHKDIIKFNVIGPSKST